MTLASQLARQVDPTIQQRGRKYFFDGAVRIVEGGPDAVKARVRGTSNYTVRLKRDKDILRVECTCPYFEDNLLTCKHVWATVLAADAQGYLNAPVKGRLRLVEEDEYDGDGYEAGHWDEWGEDEEYEEEEEFHQEYGEPSRPVYPRAAPLPPRPRSSRSVGSAGWKKQLAGLQSVMEAEHAQPRTTWPAGREVLYIIDATRTREGKGLVVEVAFRERKKDGEWSKPKVQRIGVAQISQLPDAADREILSSSWGPRNRAATATAITTTRRPATS